MAADVFPGIMVDPSIVHGRPVITGTRVPVEVVVGELAGGSSFDEIRDDYHLTDEQIRAALAYAARMLSSPDMAFIPPCMRRRHILHATSYR